MLAARARFAAAVALTCAATGSVAMPTVGSIWTCHVDERKVGFNFLNASSGVTTEAGGALLPPHSAACKNGRWRVSESPAGSAFFKQNGSLFFLAVEVCDDAHSETPRGTSVTNVSLFSVHAPFPPWCSPPQPCPPPPPLSSARRQATFSADDYEVGREDDASAPMLQHWASVWDHVCNIVVLAPLKPREGTDTGVLPAAASSSRRARALFTQRDRAVGPTPAYDVLMVSEYDGEVRAQTPLSLPQGSTLLPGLVAMQFSGKATGWPMEGNCGACPLFGVEQEHAAGAAGGRSAAAARLVGRNFHSAEELTSVPDTLQLMSLRPDPRETPWGSPFKPAPFVGLGVCCDASTSRGCDHGCAGHAGELALVAYGGGVEPAYLLMPLGTPASTESASTTTKLGVVLEPSAPFGPAPLLFARLWMDGHVVSFVLSTEESNGRLTARANGTAPVRGMASGAPLSWHGVAGM